MADRTVRVRVVAELGAYGTQMTRATAQTARFGEAAVATGRGVRAMGVSADAAGAGLAGAGAAARGGAAGLREAEVAAAATGRGVRGIGTTAAGTIPVLGRVGTAARGTFGTIRGGAAAALAPVKSLGLLLAGGALIYGLHRIIEQGNEYNDSMNKFLEVTRASGAQMASAGREAQALGSDMRLPSANAAEAADAMVDLAKAGLGAQDAIKAARGTIQLAAAAREDVATAAQIEGDVMDQFALKSTAATHVADVLANTSNSASGGLMDIYYAMKYLGPTAHSLGISLDDSATAVGLLAKSGIIGETAGTSLRGMLVNVAKATPAMKKGLKELGIEAFDEQGRFKGLSYMIGGLHDAQERLTQQQFTSAAAMAFGKPALSAATALAHQGAEAFQQYGTQVSRTGGAAALAAAESKGLGGAMRGLGKQLSSTFLQVYLGISPVLEGVTRKMTTSVSAGIPYIKRGIKTAGDLWTLYGPEAEAHLRAAEGGIGRAAAGIAGPLHQVLAGIAVNDAGLAVSAVKAVDKTLRNAGSAAAPLEGGLHDVATSVASSSGALGVLDGRIQAVMGGAGDLTGVLRPIAEVVGGLAHAFGELPGPIQLSVLAMLAMRPFRSQITSMQTAVTDFGRRGVTAFRGIGDASLYQRVQAANAGVQLSRMGGVMAELETRSRTIAVMGNSFRTTSASITAAGGRLVGFRAAAGGAATALGAGAGRGLMGAGRGLVSFLGGPWGIAIGAAMIGLDMLAKRHQEAAAAEAAHQQRVSSLAQAIQQSNGAVDANVRATAAQTLQDAKLRDGKTLLTDAMAKSGVSLKQLTDAYLGGSASVDKLQKSLLESAAAGAKSKGPFDATVQAQVKAAQTLGDLSGEVPDAVRKQKDLAAATKDAGDASGDATSPTSRLNTAITTLGESTSDAATKADALHTALDLLSGGELDVQAAVAGMHQSMTDLNSTWNQGVDKSKGWAHQLLQVDGSLNTTSENGQTLWTKLQALNESTASAAQATYDYARANNTAVVPSLQQAEAHMQTAWKTAVTTATKFGLTGDQAKIMAAQMGFIPSSLAITMSTPGVDQTTRDLLYVQGLAGHLPKGSQIKVTALTAEATKDITALGYKVHTLPGGRQVEITAPTDKAAKALDALIAKKLPRKAVGVSADTEAAIVSLDAVQKKISATKGRTVTMSAVTADAETALKKLGFDVQHTKGKQITVTIPTGSAKSARDTIQSYVNSLSGRTITVKINGVKTGVDPGQYYSQGPHKGSANGNIFSAYASGGFEQHVAQIAPGGAMRMWAEPETGGEAYIPLSPNKRGRSTSILRQVAAQFGYDLQHYADGGFTYSPGLVSVGTDDPRARFDTLVGELRDAWSTYQQAVRDLAAVKKDKRSTKSERAAAQRKVTADYGQVKSLDSQLGLPAGSAPPSTLNLKAYQKQLTESVAATDKWRTNLAKIGKRGGSEVQQLLADMGTAGYSLVNQLAGASTKQFDSIVANLKKLDDTAKASLADYTSQLTAANTTSKAFQANILKLASMGYGDLANQLAGQGDAAAAAVAAAAVKSPSAAAAANGAAKANAGLLSSDDLANATTLIGVLRSKPGAGIADVIAAGLDWATIRALAPKIAAQIKATPGSATFVDQMHGQSVAMARGGILTQPTNVLAAEAGSPESWIPWNGSDRSRALLAKTASAFGYHLTPVGAPGGGGGAPVQHITNNRSVTVNSARQTSAEMANDIVRHMAFIG